MKTTTTYRQTITITTDDDGARHIERHETADTLTAYRFTELTPEAQSRAVSDAIEEEERTYYSASSWASHTGTAEDEIWQAARDLEASQPVRFYTDQGCSVCAEARAGRYAYDAAELITIAEDTGICYSMDICDTWNTYAARILALMEGFDAAIEARDSVESAADDAALADRPEEVEAANSDYDRYDAMADRCYEVAEELTEEAARAVGDVVDGLIEAEREYYQSPEFWREWLTDSDDRYTRSGERI